MADPRQVVDQGNEAFNAHDEQRIRDLYTEDAVIEAPGDVRIQGRDAATAYAMGWLNAFPDARITVQNQIAAGDWVVEEFTFDGTHEAPLAGPAGEIPPTHRKLSGRGVQVIRVEGDKTAETRLYFDQVQVLTQLGLMPEPATA